MEKQVDEQEGETIGAYPILPVRVKTVLLTEMSPDLF